MASTHFMLETLIQVICEMWAKQNKTKTETRQGDMHSHLHTAVLTLTAGNAVTAAPWTPTCHVQTCCCRGVTPGNRAPGWANTKTHITSASQIGTDLGTVPGICIFPCVQCVYQNIITHSTNVTPRQFNVPRVANRREGNRCHNKISAGWGESTIFTC